MPKSPFVSHVPGRLRLRDPRLRNLSLQRVLLTELGAWPTALAVEGNPTTGSILLSYDPGQTAPAQVEAELTDRLARLGDGAPADAAGATAATTRPTPAAGRGAEAEPLIWRLNRVSKVGMLSSLTGSLLALRVGRRAHAALGAVHVALLMIHLATHRSRILQ